MKRIDFVFCIGFDQGTMIVDKRLKRRYRKYTCRELFDAGLYKQAFCYALRMGNDEDINWICSEYAALIQNPNLSIESMKRIFGVFSEPKDPSRSIQL